MWVPLHLEHRCSELRVLDIRMATPTCFLGPFA
uniref:Uncharacterized protein n=1 Tax=Trichinella nativa TaxID=6335 RepID=A0A0V1JTY7_9BILA